MFTFPVGMFGGGGAIAEGGANGTRFNGTSQYISHSNATGFADGKAATGSLWFNLNGRSGTDFMFAISDVFSATFGFNINATTNTITIGVGSTALQATSATAISDTTNWHHLLFSFDLTDTNKRHVYIDDVLESMTWNTYTNANIDFAPASPNYVVGARAGGDYFQGDLSEFWFDTGTYIDFSVLANRRKFRTAGGMPRDVGANGSLPTGSAPKIYLANGRTNTGTTATFTAFNNPTAVDGPNP